MTHAALAHAILCESPQRELDHAGWPPASRSDALLAMALPNRMGVPAVSMTGTQVGIVHESGPRPRPHLEVPHRSAQETARTMARRGGKAGFQGPKAAASAGTPEITPWAGGEIGPSACLAGGDWGRGLRRSTADVAGVLRNRSPPGAGPAEETVSCNEMPWSWPALGAAVLHPSPPAGRSLATTACRWWCAPAGVRPAGSPPDAAASPRPIGSGGLDSGKPVMGLNSRNHQAVVALPTCPIARRGGPAVRSPLKRRSVTSI